MAERDSVRPRRVNARAVSPHSPDPTLQSLQELIVAASTARSCTAAAARALESKALVTSYGRSIDAQDLDAAIAVDALTDHPTETRKALSAPLLNRFRDMLM